MILKLCRGKLLGSLLSAFSDSLVDQIADPSHEDIRKDHQVYNSVIDTLGGTLIALAFQHGTAHGALGLHREGNYQ